MILADTHIVIIVCAVCNDMISYVAVVHSDRTTNT